MQLERQWSAVVVLEGSGEGCVQESASAVCRAFCTGWNKSTGCLEWLCTWVGTAEEYASLGKPGMAPMVFVGAAPAGIANCEKIGDGRAARSHHGSRLFCTRYVLLFAGVA
jgi:hypothetical protein